ncbi:ABC transporter permease [Dethiosulfovibrio marinus]|jgi:NitT/TauT family transport system permease protein|nr:ABC transporter permease [Dethiosulfovibrio marinus]
MAVADRALSLLLVLGLWQSLTFFFSPLVVPAIKSVCQSLYEICSTPALYSMILITLFRLLAGLFVGVLGGVILGVIMGYSERFRNILSPMVGILQTVPPVAWVVLALVWFGFNGKPAVFIVVTATIPVISISVSEGIRNVDPGLLEMAYLYRFSERKKMFHVVFPSVMSYFNSSFKVALGLAWKIVVMGEVLTTSDGIGGMIKDARLNVEPETIIAWSIITVALFYLSGYVARFLFSWKDDGRVTSS